AISHNKFGMSVQISRPLPILSHIFTHFKLHIQPQPLQVLKQPTQAKESGQVWLSIEDAIGAAIPTPVRKILLSLTQN
ncbi:MAG: NUDIX domain-containing protein, partial [Methylotenera sp.]|nr:NUDIX domain-containing protein [Methylotenera sp.]